MAPDIIEKESLIARVLNYIPSNDNIKVSPNSTVSILPYKYLDLLRGCIRTLKGQILLLAYLPIQIKSTPTNEDACFFSSSHWQ